MLCDDPTPTTLSGAEWSYGDANCRKLSAAARGRDVRGIFHVGAGGVGGTFYSYVHLSLILFSCYICPYYVTCAWVRAGCVWAGRRACVRAGVRAGERASEMRVGEHAS